MTIKKTIFAIKWAYERVGNLIPHFSAHAKGVGMKSYYLISTRKHAKCTHSRISNNRQLSYSEWLSTANTLHWRHNDHDGVSNHQPHGCLLSRLFRRRSKKTSRLCVTGLCVGNSPGPVNSSHRPFTRKIFPFDDVIMRRTAYTRSHP